MPNRVFVIGAVLLIVILLLVEVLVFGLGWGLRSPGSGASYLWSSTTSVG
jgi:hypothetical protein